MKKRILTILLLLGIFISISGCGTSNNNNVTFNQETADKLGDTGGLKLPLSDAAETIEWSVTTSHEDFNNSWFAVKLREVTGLNVQFPCCSCSYSNG